jgi:hypothetical protein
MGRMMKRRLNALVAATSLLALVGVAQSPSAYAAGRCATVNGGRGTLCTVTTKVFDRNQGWLLKSVGDQYAKVAGGREHSRFGWVSVSCSTGREVGPRIWDRGAFYQDPGQTRSFFWNYSPPIEAPTYCLKGLLWNLDHNTVAMTGLVQWILN